jgi:hypothetical protein
LFSLIRVPLEVDVLFPIGTFKREEFLESCIST